MNCNVLDGEASYRNLLRAQTVSHCGEPLKGQLSGAVGPRVGGIRRTQK